MSQQHMEYNPSYSDEAASYSGGYHGETPLAQNFPSQSYNQKLAASQISQNVSAAQRLALAIVSLSLFAFILMVFAALGFTSLATNGGLFVFTGVLILVLYSIVALLINFIFNRGRY